MNLFERVYKEYTEKVSPDYMASSLGCAHFLYSAAIFYKPSKILDLGSGFSSYVLRTYSEEHEVQPLVFSVDTSKKWLNRTQKFLESYAVATDNMLLLTEFEESEEADFDFIFYDIGDMMVRTKCLEKLEVWAARSCVIVLDDMHKRKFRDRAYSFLQEKGFELRSLQRATTDEYSRFLEIAVRGGKGEGCQSTLTSSLSDVGAVEPDSPPRYCNALV